MTQLALPTAADARPRRSVGRSAALAELNDVWETCRTDNWDGYGARAATVEARAVAERLLRNIPDDLPNPSFGAEPDGSLTMEWHHQPRWTLSVSIGGDDLLHYSALFGRNTESGTVEFLDAVPEAILRLARRVCDGC